MKGTSLGAVALGGKSGSYYLSPRNLLDNSDFKNPVNQRGVSGTISTAGYFIDRWKLISGSVTIGEEGLTLDGEIAQILENAPDGNVTAAASAGTATFDAGTNTFSLTASGELVSWVVLYEGEYTADTLPPYVSKGYAAELAECQRYYQIFKNVNSVTAHISFLAANSARTTYYGCVNLMVPMRALPTVGWENLEIWNGSIGHITISGLSIYAYDTGISKLTLAVTIASAASYTNGAALSSAQNTTGYLELSADL